MERLEVTDTTNRSRSGWLAASFFGLGIPFFVLCASGHLCRCGHLAHSPTLWDRTNDILWIGLFSLSILSAGASLSQSGFWRPFGICVSLLAWTRLLFIGWFLEWEIAFGVLSVVFAVLALTHSSPSDSRSRWSRWGLGRSAVLVTLLVLGASAGFFPENSRDLRWKRQEAIWQLEWLASVVRTHYYEKGSWPATLRELEWDLDEEPPTDPWSGEDFLYEYAGNGPPTLISLGADGARGGVDSAEDLILLVTESLSEERWVSEAELAAFLRSRANRLGGAELYEELLEEFGWADESDLKEKLSTLAQRNFARAPSVAEALCALVGLEDVPGLVRARLESGEFVDDETWCVGAALELLDRIQSDGISSVYFSVEGRLYDERIRAFQIIRAGSAANVMLNADALFGESGPPRTLEERGALEESMAPELDRLTPTFLRWERQIRTRAFLHAAQHLRPVPGDEGAEADSEG